MSVSEIIAQTEHKMKATVEHTREEFVKIRTAARRRSIRWPRSAWATPAR